MGLAERVTAGDQGDGFLIVHGHARKGLTDVPGRGQWVGVAVRALRIDVDQAHLDGGQGCLQVAVAAVALIGQPLAFGTPVDVFLGLPDVGATAAKAERLEAHGLQRDVAGQDHQVGPRELAAILLLDRPQQAACLVQVVVVRPAVERCKTLGARARPATAVTGAIGASAMPGHPDEERAIVAVVCGPPGLRVRHQGVQVGHHSVEVEAPEFGRVVEVGVHRIRQAGMLV